VVLEALVGQLYPATLLARLVSLEISHRPSGTGMDALTESAAEKRFRRRKRNPHITP